MTIDFNDTIIDEVSNPKTNVVPIKRAVGRPKGSGKKASSVSAQPKHSLGATEDRFTTRPIEQIAELIGERFEFRYDEVLLRIEYREAGGEWKPMKDAMTGVVNSHARVLAREDGGDVLKCKGTVNETIAFMADKNPHHPIKAYLEECLAKFNAFSALNKTDPLADLMDHIHLVEGKDRLKVFLSRWLLGCVAKVLEPDGHQNFVLTFLGGQGWGKSVFAEWLCSGIGEGKHQMVFQEGQIHPENKDHVLRLAKKWIWSASEIDGTVKKKDVAELKEFLTMNYLCERAAFFKYDFNGRSICSFIASVNSEQFLKDETGNRRFAALPMSRKLDFDYKKNVDIDMVWGQVMFLYQCGIAYDDEDFSCMSYPHHPTLPSLSAEEKLWQKEQNEECFDVDPLEEQLHSWLVVTKAASDFVFTKDIRAKVRSGEFSPRSPCSADRSWNMKIAAVMRRVGRSVGKAVCSEGRFNGYRGVAWRGEEDKANLLNSKAIV